MYLRESYGPMVAFLYGWSVFTIVECGSIAAVAMALRQVPGDSCPAVSETRYLAGPLEVPGLASDLPGSSWGRTTWA